MKKFNILVILLIVFIANSSFAELTGDDIVKKADAIVNRGDFICNLEMNVYKGNEITKTYKMEMFSAGLNKMLVLFDFPPRDKGRAYLKNEDKMWIYLPEVKKSMRIPEQQSFEGSDFNNHDVLEINLQENYRAEIIGEEDINGRDAYKLELKSKTKKVVYDKIIYWVSKKDFAPLKREFFSLSGKKLKTLILEKDNNLSDFRPDAYIMSNEMERDKKTIMKVSNLREHVRHDGKIFTLEYLERRR